MSLSMSLKYTRPHASEVAGDMVSGSTCALLLERRHAAQQQTPRHAGHIQVLVGSRRLGGGFSL